MLVPNSHVFGFGMSVFSSTCFRLKITTESLWSELIVEEGYFIALFTTNQDCDIYY